MNITLVGLGHLGTVAAVGLASSGHHVTGIDVDRRRTDALQTGRVLLYEPGLEGELQRALRSGHLRFLHSDEMHDELGDIIVVATGTPSTNSGAADLAQVWHALSWLKTFDLQNRVVLMKSTVPPGTGCAISLELNAHGAGYVSNPEFLREGRALEDWRSPDRIVIGLDQQDDRPVEVVRRVYSDINAPCVITDITSAEMIKYASNAFLAARISFINEMASVCDRVGASIDAVAEGMALDPRTGGKMHAGIGYGGSCFPKDVRALHLLATTYELDLELLKSVSLVNSRQHLLPLQALRRRFGADISSLVVSVLGLAFKPDTDDMRQAPSLDVIGSLLHEGTTVRAFDPQANGAARVLLPSSVIFAEGPVEACYRANAVVLLTEWGEIVEADWEAIASCMCSPKLLFDGRNALDPRAMANLGFDYMGVGRGTGQK